MRRFGVIVMPDAPAAEMSARFRRIEESGFDQLYLADHIGDFRDVSGPFLDGWSLLAAAAVQTSRIWVGPLVNNPILRAPAVVAKQAMTIDQLSGGRLELGLGAGVFEMDHYAVGTAPWPVRERVQRFAEYTTCGTCRQPPARHTTHR
jgi:alkanesulfonate monooxygenase SsuD/methylene tetrahydromethanopterin reductase-like flavin-dependent oxidoreductase (luciferase family)